MVEAGKTRILFLLREKCSDEYPKIPILKELSYDIPYPVMLSGSGLKGLLEGILKKLEEAFTKGMKDLCLTILHRNSKELTDYVAYNDELFGKLLKEIGLIK